MASKLVFTSTNTLFYHTPFGVKVSVVRSSKTVSAVSNWHNKHHYVQHVLSSEEVFSSQLKFYNCFYVCYLRTYKNKKKRVH